MNNDLISRDALKQEMKIANAEAIDYEMLVDMYEKLVDNAPTVKACFTTKDLEDAYITGKESGKQERPKGEWQYATHYARRYRICPFCKSEKEDDRSAGCFYCWHCGADMRGVTNSEANN